MTSRARFIVCELAYAVLAGLVLAAHAAGAKALVDLKRPMGSKVQQRYEAARTANTPAAKNGPNALELTPTMPTAAPATSRRPG